MSKETPSRLALLASLWKEESKNTSWTNWFPFCVCSERGTCWRGMPSRVGERWMTCAASLLWKTILWSWEATAWAAHCALTALLNELMPSDLPPNFSGPECGQGSWEKITTTCMYSLHAWELLPRSPLGQVHWKHGGKTAFPMHCRCTAG